MLLASIHSKTTGWTSGISEESNGTALGEAGWVWECFDFTLLRIVSGLGSLSSNGSWTCRIPPLPLWESSWSAMLVFPSNIKFEKVSVSFALVFTEWQILEGSSVKFFPQAVHYLGHPQTMTLSIVPDRINGLLVLICHVVLLKKDRHHMHSDCFQHALNCRAFGRKHCRECSTPTQISSRHCHKGL